MRLPSPRRMVGALVERARGLRYFLADIAYVIARLPRAIGSGAARFWSTLPITARRRLAAAAGAVVLVLFIAGAVVPNLPCSFPGGDECPPANDAIELAPAASVAFVHANLDGETRQAANAGELAGRVPLVAQQVAGQLGRFAGQDARGAITEPWFGGEVALIVLDQTGEQVTLVETTDEAAARRFAGQGGAEPGEYREVEVAEGRGGRASAVVDGFLVTGSGGGVREVLDVATGADGAEALADVAEAEETLDELPEHRFAEAYLSPDGLQAFVADRRAPLASLEPLVDAGTSRGAALALVVEPDRIELAVRSSLDPERQEAEPGFFAAFDEFEPELVDRVDRDALFYLGLASPRETIDALLAQATVRAPGIAAGVARLIKRLRGQADVDLQKDLFAALGGEAAFSVVPRTRVDADDVLSPAEEQTPYLEFLADDVDGDAALETLAGLQGPVVRELDPEFGAPGFDKRRIGEVDAHVLRLSPLVQIVYAVVDSLLVIANDPVAVERLASDEDGLGDSGRFEDALDDLPDEPILAAYADLRALLAFAERSGLAEDAAYTAFAGDLRRLDTLGLTVSRDDALLETDARLAID